MKPLPVIMLVVCFYITACTDTATRNPKFVLQNEATFQIEDFTIADSTNRIKTEKAEFTGFLDIHFYKSHFNLFYHLPEKHIDTQYKSETVTIRRSATLTVNHGADWSATYTYDAQSKLISYTYWGCKICSQLPFSYHLFYDQSNKLVRIERSYNTVTPMPEHQTKHDSKASAQPLDMYILQYDAVGNIHQIDYYQTGKLQKRIIRTQ